MRSKTQFHSIHWVLPISQLMVWNTVTYLSLPFSATRNHALAWQLKVFTNHVCLWAIGITATLLVDPFIKLSAVMHWVFLGTIFLAGGPTFFKCNKEFFYFEICWIERKEELEELQNGSEWKSLNIEMIDWLTISFSLTLSLSLSLSLSLTHTHTCSHSRSLPPSFLLRQFFFWTSKSQKWQERCLSVFSLQQKKMNFISEFFFSLLDGNARRHRNGKR